MMVDVRSQASRVLNARYTWERELGRGVATRVHLGRDLVLDRPVVVKLYGRSFLAGIGGYDAFVARAIEVENLEHPAIAALNDFGKAGESAFAVYERLGGGNLEERVAKGRMTAGEVRNVLRRVASALQAAHAASVYHGRLTPRKVLFDDKGRAYISGFAWGTGAGALSDGRWLSPQRREGAPAELADDVYSLAALTFFMLFAEAPPWDGDFGRWWAALRDGGSPELADVLARALSPDPQGRFSDTESFAHDVDAALSRLATGWVAPGPMAQESPPEMEAEERWYWRSLRRPSAVRMALAGIAAFGVIAMSVLLIGGEDTARAPGAAPTLTADARDAEAETPATNAAGSLPESRGPRIDEVAGSRTDPAGEPDDACSGEGWQGFVMGGGAPLFPSEAACHRAFEAGTCPEPPVMTVELEPGPTVRWDETCGATDYWVEVAFADGRVEQLHFGADDERMADVTELVGEATEFELALTAFYDDPALEWSHVQYISR